MIQSVSKNKKMLLRGILKYVNSVLNANSDLKKCEISTPWSYVRGSHKLIPGVNGVNNYLVMF